MVDVEIVQLVRDICVYLQCQQCNSKYHTLFRTRFNHFLNARKLTKSIKTYTTNANRMFHDRNRMDFIVSCFLHNEKEHDTLFIDFDS